MKRSVRFWLRWKKVRHEPVFLIATAGRQSGPDPARQAVCRTRTQGPGDKRVVVPAMSMSFIHGTGGQHIAFITCDSCNAQITVTTGPRSTRRDMRRLAQKLSAQGWAESSLYGVMKKYHCPACAAKRRAGMAQISKEKDSENMAMKSVKKAASDAAVEAAKTPLRQPTQEQRGDIIEMLVTCYDRKARRYSGSETDKTVAEAIGGGCMPGWVAEIRERDFGPSGGNEEIEGIRTDIAALTADVEAKIAALTGRLDRVCAAVGPRAR